MLFSLALAMAVLSSCSSDDMVNNLAKKTVE